VSRRNRHVSWEERLIEGFIALLDKPFRDARKSREHRVKFLGYHDLLKILKDSVCPVCSIINRSLHHYINVAFIEEITSGEFREKLRETLGYCRRHSNLLIPFIDRELHGMGIGMVYEDLLEQARMHLSSETVEEVPAQKNCPLCDLEKEIEEYAIRLVADYSADAEFQQAYNKAQGACLPHLRMLLEKSERSGREYLFSAHERKLSTLLSHLNEFIRKQDYRFRDEGCSDEEVSSWKRAVYFFTRDLR